MIVVHCYAARNHILVHRVQLHTQLPPPRFRVACHHYPTTALYTAFNRAPHPSPFFCPGECIAALSLQLEVMTCSTAVGDVAGRRVPDNHAGSICRAQPRPHIPRSTRFLNIIRRHSGGCHPIVPILMPRSTVYMSCSTTASASIYTAFNHSLSHHNPCDSSRP